MYPEYLQQPKLTDNMTGHLQAYYEERQQESPCEGERVLEGTEQDDNERNRQDELSCGSTHLDTRPNPCTTICNRPKSCRRRVLYIREVSRTPVKEDFFKRGWAEDGPREDSR